VSTPKDTGDAAAPQPTRRRGGERLRRLWQVGESPRLTTVLRLGQGFALGLVVALLATTLPAALDDPDDL
jgi:hypothetical protein